MRTLCKEKTDTTEGTIKNRQYRDIDNTWYTKHKTTTNKGKLCWTPLCTNNTNSANKT